MGAGDSPMPPVCVLAGGLGTRLGELTRTTPKPILEVAGEPFVFHQLRLLASYGVTRAVLCVGHLGELVESTVGPSRCGVEVAYSYDSPGLDGTLGAIRRALPLLGERFLVLYGDTYLRLDYRAVVAAWAAGGRPAVMSVLRNASRWDRSNAVFADGLVTAYDKHSPTPEMKWIDYGLGGFEADAIALVGPDESDLSALQHTLAERRLLQGFEASERFYEIGTPEALAETDRFLRSIAPGPPDASDAPDAPDAPDARG